MASPAGRPFSSLRVGGHQAQQRLFKFVRQLRHASGASLAKKPPCSTSPSSVPSGAGRIFSSRLQRGSWMIETGLGRLAPLHFSAALAKHLVPLTAQRPREMPSCSPRLRQEKPSTPSRENRTGRSLHRPTHPWSGTAQLAELPEPTHRHGHLESPANGTPSVTRPPPPPGVHLRNRMRKGKKTLQTAVSSPFSARFLGRGVA